jgi:metal-sulfur cluster biosynthetic enzyme
MSAATSSNADERSAQVWARLQAVSDPELDESVTALGFVTSVAVGDAGDVRIGFRLPTYWCAANFAFLMADDMRAVTASLPWVTRVAVELDEHMYAAQINSGIAGGLSFQQSFGDAANDDLTEVRRTFLVKAFQRRQEALLGALLANGHDAHALLQLKVHELTALATNSADLQRLIDRYIERRFVIAEPAENAQPMQQLAFVDREGAPLDAATLGGYLRALRRVGVNAEFNSALCRGLLAARYADADRAPPRSLEEQPVHFVARQTYQEMAARNAGAGEA